MAQAEREMVYRKYVPWSLEDMWHSFVEQRAVFGGEAGGVSPWTVVYSPNWSPCLQVIPRITLVEC